ncbi:hypothetical protein GCM10009827_043310 [Dactylosporangium maewongense]|uniref:Uncharacterized protein n=1 Tax=Dactylosporangium maewongense TaxID=634393 RepID=A0ABP4LHT2_9ACTN
MNDLSPQRGAVSDVEQRVRDLMHRHAAEAPAGAALLTVVRAESRRRARRTRVVVGAVVAVLATVGVTVPLRLAAAPVAVAAPSVLASPSGPLTVTFPLSPPPSGTDPEVRLAAGLPTLSQPLPDDAATATLTVSPTRPLATGTEPIMVRGVVGYTAESDDTGTSLIWQEAPGQWFELRASPAVPVDRLAGFAKGLLPQPVSVPAPFTFALVPDGYTVDNISPAAVTFCPPDVTADETFVGKLTVMLGVTGELSTGRAVDVAGRPGILTDPVDGFFSLQVDLGDGRLLVIQSATPVPLPEPDLIRFAAGITVNPNATPGQG